MEGFGEEEGESVNVMMPLVTRIQLSTGLKYGPDNAAEKNVKASVMECGCY